ncbi:MAG TPA: type II secretion system F family protein [Candidatus Nanoarchaeia archaeon]|nr:type II secretion system F family protein [Candidatus Nanoarchaeia archaeon]
MAIEKLRENFERQKKIAEEIRELSEELRDSRNAEERGIISSQIESLKKYLRKYGEGVVEAAEGISVPKPLDISKTVSGYKMQPVIQPMKGISPEKAERFDEKISALERLTLGRMKKKEVKVIKRKEKKPSLYVKLASSLFYDTAMSLIKKGKFYMLRRDLIRANLEFVPATYISLIFFTTIVSFFAAMLITGFFLFFNLVASPPFLVAVEESLGLRFLKVFWILFAVPAGVYLFAYFYPSMEKKTLENRINRELPFATIHMSSISNSMIEPSKIFSIIISTEEYPNLEKEFTKLFNEVNVYGYDLVTALRDMAFNSPSRKLAELYNGLATTITSGGDLPNFFDKRAQTLLFEHRLETEKHSKAAETFMDIYISVVIAAPMILMLLLMMMRLSGLGISLSTGMITLVMVLGVSLMNVLFLSFLHLKQPEGA